jgi:hypothetical protein
MQLIEIVCLLRLIVELSIKKTIKRMPYPTYPYVISIIPGAAFRVDIEAMAPQDILLFILSNIFINLTMFNLYNINVKKNIAPLPRKRTKSVPALLLLCCLRLINAQHRKFVYILYSINRRQTV